MHARTYWHGGPDGLDVGDVIVPAGELAALPALYDLDPSVYPSDRSRVHITSSRAVGLGYASNMTVQGGGSLYRVDPVGPLEEDPDAAGLGLCWTAERAVITAVEARSVRMHVCEHVRLHAPLMHWDDGTPVYDVRGRLLLNDRMRAFGFTEKDLARLGEWVPLEVAQIALGGGHVPSRGEVRALVEEYNQRF